MVTSSRGEVLIVDDVASNRQLLEGILKNAGYIIRLAEDGETALNIIAEHPPQLILMDILMPGLTGYQVTETLKADSQTAHIPIIFISALNETDSIVKAFEVGGVDYITKPFKIKEVLARVNSQIMLAQQRLEIENLREKDRQYYETVNNIKDQFIRAATHDLKSPLALILGYASLLENLKPEEFDSMRQFVDGVKQGAEKMVFLVSDMLDLLQMESGQALERRTINLAHFMSLPMENFAFQAEQKSITFDYQRPDKSLSAYIAPNRMSQVLDNLITNAIKYTPENGSITVCAYATDTHYVALEIADTGLGIPEEDIPHLFDAFYRVRSGSHRDIEGTGLGLSIVAAIIEQHEGTVEVESQLGEGSIFRVIIPQSGP